MGWSELFSNSGRRPLLRVLSRDPVAVASTEESLPFVWGGGGAILVLIECSPDVGLAPSAAWRAIRLGA